MQEGYWFPARNKNHLGAVRGYRPPTKGADGDSDAGVHQRWLLDAPPLKEAFVGCVLPDVGRFALLGCVLRMRFLG